MSRISIENLKKVECKLKTHLNMYSVKSTHSVAHFSLTGKHVTYNRNYSYVMRL